jgi:hypothetical protein
MSTIDLAPVVDNIVIPLLAPIVMVIAGWAAAKLATFLGLKNDDKRRLVLTHVADQAAQAAINLAQEQPLKFQTRNAQVAKAVDFINTNAPGAVKALGLTPEAVENLVHARLPGSPDPVLAQAQLAAQANPPLAVQVQLTPGAETVTK